MEPLSVGTCSTLIAFEMQPHHIHVVAAPELHRTRPGPMLLSAASVAPPALTASYSYCAVALLRWPRGVRSASSRSWARASGACRSSGLGGEPLRLGMLGARMGRDDRVGAGLWHTHALRQRRHQLLLGWPRPRRPLQKC